MRNSNTIKNLSIALEALSRIPESTNLSYRVRELLETCLTEDETPAKPYVRPAPSNTDDEIPF